MYNNSFEKSSMDSSSENSRFLPDISETITKLKSENFHLRLRCHDLDSQLSNCNCFDNDQNTSKRDFLDHKMELNKAMQSRQELEFKNEDLIAENKLLNDKCSDLISDLQVLRLKFDKLNEIAESKEREVYSVDMIMRDNDDLMKNNLELKQELSNLKEQLLNKNLLFLEDERKRRKSLSHSLNKLFKEANDSSINVCEAGSVTCIQCAELKVYSDKLSESMIKVSVNFESQRQLSEIKNKEIEDLKKQIASLRVMDIEHERVKKCKYLAKKSLLQYATLKEEKEEARKKYEKLIEFYITQQGEQQKELSLLKKKSNEEKDQLANDFSSRWSEVMEAQAQMVEMVSSVGLNQQRHQDEYYQVGQYSPQYKIPTCDITNSTVESVAESVFHHDISHNETAFKYTLDASLTFESDLRKAFDNLSRKVKDLGESVRSYFGMLKVEKCAERHASTREQTRNDEDEINDNVVLKKMYAEEKEQFESRLSAQASTISELTGRVTYIEQKYKDVRSAHKKDAVVAEKQLSDVKEECQQQVEKVSILEGKLMDRDEALKSAGERQRAHKKEAAVAAKQLSDVKEECQQQVERVSILEGQLRDRDEALEAAGERQRINEAGTRLLEDRLAAATTEMERLVRDNGHLTETVLVANENFGLLLEAIARMARRARFLATEHGLIDDGCNDKDDDDEKTVLLVMDRIEARLRQSERQGAQPLMDLTNVTDIEDEPLAVSEVVPLAQGDLEQKHRYIRDHPEKTRAVLLKYRDECVYLKKMVLSKHEQLKAARAARGTALQEDMVRLTADLEEYGRQLELCKKCLWKAPGDLPEDVLQEMGKLGLL